MNACMIAGLLMNAGNETEADMGRKQVGSFSPRFMQERADSRRCAAWAAACGAGVCVERAKGGRVTLVEAAHCLLYRLDSIACIRT